MTRDAIHSSAFCLERRNFYSIVGWLKPFSVLFRFRSVFRHLIQVDPDALWFTLNELHCPASYVPPHPALQPVTLSGMGRHRDEYSDNVLKLLREEFDSGSETAGESVS